MAARRGGLIANIALARKLAVLFWRVMVKGLDYVEERLARYDPLLPRPRKVRAPAFPRRCKVMAWE